jgi:hypothetical protein
MSAEREEDVAKEKDTGGAVADSVMRGEDESAVRLLMEQYSAEERSLIGSERCIYFFGDLLLPLRKGRRNHAERDALAGDATKVRDAVEGGVNAGGEQRVALLYCIERVTPLLDAYVAGDLGRKCTVCGKYWSKRQKSSSKAPRGRRRSLGWSARGRSSREVEDMRRSF